MRIGVVTFPGSLDDGDAARAARLAGAEAVRLWHADPDLHGVDAVVLPGGFSYGDYLRCGAIARFAPVMETIKKAAADGLPVLGICNGFQILCEAHLLPGALTRNQHLHFRNRDQRLRLENVAGAWTGDYADGQEILIPVKNGEGCFVADADTLDRLESNGQVVARYLDGNPNGSMRDIAAIRNEAGNVLGIMPHPEHAVEALTGPSLDGLGFFTSVLRHLANGSAPVSPGTASGSLGTAPASPVVPLAASRPAVPPAAASAFVPEPANRPEIPLAAARPEVPPATVAASVASPAATRPGVPPAELSADAPSADSDVPGIPSGPEAPGQPVSPTGNERVSSSGSRQEPPAEPSQAGPAEAPTASSPDTSSSTIGPPSVTWPSSPAAPTNEPSSPTGRPSKGGPTSVTPSGSGPASAAASSAGGPFSASGQPSTSGPSLSAPTFSSPDISEMSDRSTGAGGTSAASSGRMAGSSTSSGFDTAAGPSGGTGQTSTSAGSSASGEDSGKSSGPAPQATFSGRRPEAPGQASQAASVGQAPQANFSTQAPQVTTATVTGQPPQATFSGPQQAAQAPAAKRSQGGRDGAPTADGGDAGTGEESPSGGHVSLLGLREAGASEATEESAAEAQRRTSLLGLRENQPEGKA